jgi:hypothetical protein
MLNLVDTGRRWTECRVTVAAAHCRLSDKSPNTRLLYLSPHLHFTDPVDLCGHTRSRQGARCIVTFHAICCVNDVKASVMATKLSVGVAMKQCHLALAVISCGQVETTRVAAPRPIHWPGQYTRRFQNRCSAQPASSRDLSICTQTLSTKRPSTATRGCQVT